MKAAEAETCERSASGGRVAARSSFCYCSTVAVAIYCTLPLLLLLLLVVVVVVVLPLLVLEAKSIDEEKRVPDIS